MSQVRVAAIVEGHGEVDAVPILLRRLAERVDPGLAVHVHPVLRVPASRLMKQGELERSVELAARKVGRADGILILLDCDWPEGCPARDGPLLLGRARATRPDMPLCVVFAKREYEAWFIAAADSLKGRRGLSVDLAAASAPEEIRGAKEWLSRYMPKGRPYAETTDQPALTAIFDLDVARRADSFDKCFREIVSLLTALQNSTRSTG